ncbi:thiosulfate sulfurtransferase [Geopseudomonas sagittaria]|uniref:Thiosulfate sulfurtransferase n=1 Tax=Geopseudomonas sagittaria TaxID=1135990 RepID=A0A1I5V7P5_9GAMM|nr:rhodanese-like domain-containing protein [Pseudomonas sagittaria]MCM2332314.1 rhodanese-like domain-containing protein [Pseudomonas sagittaria]SFQ03543.1 thiosulfate sulfurtransferase [Pseudomonas sagittaria]
MSDFKCISVEHAEALLRGGENVMLLDIRDARAYCQGHDPRAIHLSDTTLRSLVRFTPRQVHLIVYGDEAPASAEMVRFFSDYGFVNSYSLDGGYAAWQARRGQQAGMPRRAALSLAAHG